MLIPTDRLRERLVGQHLHIAGRLLQTARANTGLLGDILGQTFQIPSAPVLVRGITLPIKELERRETLNTEPLAQIAVRVGINFSDLHLVGGVGEGLAQLLVCRSEALAVATPGREELDERRFAGFEDNFVEVLGAEFEDGGVGSGADNGDEERNRAHEKAPTSHE